MDELKKMLRAIINSQSAQKEELLTEIKKVNESMSEGFRNVDSRLTKIDARLDKQGKALAFLEDDAPTRKEFDVLEKRVTKVENKISVA